MDWSDIALPTGSPRQGDFGLYLNFTLPEAKCALEASDRQISAVNIFYQIDLTELNDSQAHILLCCREYARLCAAIVFKRYPIGFQEIMARGLAAFILSDAAMTEFATKWSDRNFERGSSSPRVRGTPFFEDVAQFASYLEGMIELNGWTLGDLKRLRVV
jgi:hypothetical protein